ncbi:hypothetical protein BDN72DRAFT_865663, partial [Pluteus cervinus]
IGGEWGTEKLDALVKNAAQTSTGSVEKERVWIEREGRVAEASRERTRRQRQIGGRGFEHNYMARARVGVDPNLMIYERERVPLTGLTGSSIPDHVATPSSSSILYILNSESAQCNDNDNVKVMITTAAANSNVTIGIMKPSWMQHIDGIPYEDVISAHGVKQYFRVSYFVEGTCSFDGATSTASSASSTSNPYALLHVYTVDYHHSLHFQFAFDDDNTTSQPST